jgi:hypothetical protein
MSQPELKKKEMIQFSPENTTSDEDHLASWYDSAFHAAVEKLQTKHAHPDTVMRIGEAFGRGLFTQELKEKTASWTIKQWVEEIQQTVLKPLGSEFTFTKISPDVATTFLNRNPLTQPSQDRMTTSLFNFGVLRGLFLSAFPKGELLLNETETTGDQEYTFKAYASAKDKLEREHALRTFTFLKKENGT